MFPSDHYATDDRGFSEAAQRAAITSDRLGRLVLVGTMPDHADPDYGWIIPGTTVGPGTWTVERFAEQPDPATAEHLFRNGGLWNTLSLLRQRPRSRYWQTRTCRSTRHASTHGHSGADQW